MALHQSTQFVIEQLSIVSKDGSHQYDIQGIYQELNIFENLMMPCMSGNIIIHDAVGLSTTIKYDGSEYLELIVTKDSENNIPFSIEKRFVIYKQSDRKDINQNSEVYILHFVSEEFILSQQKKVRQTYSGTYSDIVTNILKDYLKLELKPRKEKKDGIDDNILMMVEKTTGIKKYNVPNLSPLNAVKYIAKRATNAETLPDYLFWETSLGYNFVSLSTLLTQTTIATITYGTKNLTKDSEGYYISDELYGARNIKIDSQFNLLENINNGTYAGKFVGYDTLTRTIAVNTVSHTDIYNKTTKHANQYPFNYKIPNKENITADLMYDPKITVYPFQTPRTTASYLKSTDTNTANIIDDTHNYILQRKAIFANLLQRKLTITMPGNFNYMAGYMVEVQIPNRFDMENSNIKEVIDNSLSGKYIIIAVRHIIRQDKHETILEVATDSTNMEY